MKHFLLLLLLYSKTLVSTATSDNSNDLIKAPTVFICILVRNKVSVLPYFLTLFTRIEYPKERIHVWIRSDHNEDDSANVLKIWAEFWHSHYKTIDLIVNNSHERLENETSIASWPESRYRHVINLREEALDSARRSWADYIWFLDCDALLVDPQTLKNLIQHDKIVAAPMLLSDSMYSNFWCGMTSSYYYERTNEYEKILNRKKIGCFSVPMVHSAVLINLRLRLSDSLTFDPDKVLDYDGPIDDIITFAVAANRSGIPLHICNDLKYGYTTIPLEETGNLVEEKEHLLNLKLHITVDDHPFEVDELFLPLVRLPPKRKFGFDEIFVINLKRRSERRLRMQYCVDEMGIDVTFIDGVDGKLLGNEELKEMGVTLMSGYEDPYYKRPMKKGEIGCFLSHYKIWRKVLDDNMSHVLILEDDVRFEKYFIRKLENLIVEIRRFFSKWDLIYLGRKIMKPKEESFLEGSDILVHPDYTYWTIGYIISRNGTEKLIKAKPLSKLIPVDEYLPIMYDKHPRDDWKAYFQVRNLRALSVNPLIIFPMKYTNEEGYVSDTEDSYVEYEKKVKHAEL